jgi:hypothetical protein
MPAIKYYPPIYLVGPSTTIRLGGDVAPAWTQPCAELAHYVTYFVPTQRPGKASWIRLNNLQLTFVSPSCIAGAKTYDKPTVGHATAGSRTRRCEQPPESDDSAPESLSSSGTYSAISKGRTECGRRGESDSSD